MSETINLWAGESLPLIDRLCVLLAHLLDGENAHCI